MTQAERNKRFEWDLGVLVPRYQEYLGERPEIRMANEYMRHTTFNAWLKERDLRPVRLIRFRTAARKVFQAEFWGKQGK